MKNLNDDNGAAGILLKYAKELLRVESGHLIGAELGIAYGGGVEAIGKLWKGRGDIYGFDTFDTHPKQLSYSKESHEAYCMDPQYEMYGTDGLSYEYQRAELDRQGLDNVHLQKGLIHEKSLEGIPYLNYALLDLDIVNSMLLGWSIVEPKLMPGAYFCLHDCTPHGHIRGLWGMYQEIMKSDKYWLIEEVPGSFLVVLRKK